MNLLTDMRRANLRTRSAISPVLRANAVSAFDERWLDGLSVYQDIIWAGHRQRTGVRDCDARWRLIEPHLARQGAVLDVGSNFGWFGLHIAASRPDCVVASVEGNARSASVQRAILASHQGERIALLTRRSTATGLSTWGGHGQRFAAALCLSVLHWMPDHREYLLELARLSECILIECPAADEENVGIASVRRAQARMGDYLSGLFSARHVTSLGSTRGLHSASPEREIWLVRCRPAVGGCKSSLALAGLWPQGLSWPRRNWWVEQCEQNRVNDQLPAGWWLTAAGLARGYETRRGSLWRWQRRIRRLPEQSLLTPGERLRRALRGTARLALGRRAST